MGFKSANKISNDTPGSMMEPDTSTENAIHMGRKFNGDVVDLTQILEITKPVRNEFLIEFVRRISPLKSLLKRPEDSAIFNVFLSITFTVLPLSIALAICERNAYLPDWGLHALGLIRFIFGVKQTEGFVLGLHFHSHRSMFLKGCKWIERWIRNVVSPLMGFPCNTYFEHHILMHHKEDNQIWYDASSTMIFQRDSLIQLCAYISRFVLLIQFELPIVLAIRRRYQALLHMVAGYYGWLAFCVIGYQYLPVATTWGLIFPYAFLSFMAMSGNFTQHIFVDPDDPANDYKLSFDLVNDPGNERKFNDGFHVEHHLFPLTHWMDLPKKFLQLLPKHIENDSLIFDGIHNYELNYYVMSGNLERLADYYVYIGQKSGKDKKTLVAEMKKRLQPIRTLTDTKEK